MKCNCWLQHLIVIDVLLAMLLFSVSNTLLALTGYSCLPSCSLRGSYCMKAHGTQRRLKDVKKISQRRISYKPRLQLSRQRLPITIICSSLLCIKCNITTLGLLSCDLFPKLPLPESLDSWYCEFLFCDKEVSETCTISNYSKED